MNRAATKLAVLDVTFNLMAVSDPSQVRWDEYKTKKFFFFGFLRHKDIDIIGSGCVGFSFRRPLWRARWILR